MIDLDKDDHQIDQANSFDNDIKSQSKNQNDQVEHSITQPVHKSQFQSHSKHVVEPHQKPDEKVDLKSKVLSAEVG